MRAGTVGRLPRVHGLEHQNDPEKEHGQTADAGSAAPAESSNGSAKTAAVHGAAASGTALDETEETPGTEQTEQTREEEAEATDHRSRVAPVSLGIPRLMDELVVADEFAGEDTMPAPEPDSDGIENMLEVDDDADEQAESVYAVSQYPAVPTGYRVERFDSVTINSSSRSLYVEELDYNLENGRRYCGNYIFPNDELEQDRLRLMHQVFLHVFDLELTSVPLDDPQIILDIGTGTGEWAIGMGELFPECEVTGVDISAIQPTAVPHNVFFEVDDCEIDWMRHGDAVDLVHLRDMAGAFADWDFIYREALGCLKPGGYIEILDFHNYASDPNALLSYFPPDAQIHRFVRSVDEASIKAGRRRGIHHLDTERLQRIGFVDVRVVEHSIPLNPLVDPAAKLWLIACLHSVEAGSLRLLTKYLDWDPSEAFALCDSVCREIKERALRASATEAMGVSLRVLTARKPTAEESALLPRSHGPEPTLSALPPAENGRATGGDHSGGDKSTIGG